MIETYFAIKVFALYAMIALLASCAIIFLGIMIMDTFKKRFKKR